MKNSLFIYLLIGLFVSNSYSQNGSITNILVEQRTDESGLVDIYFDLNGQDNAYYMNLEVSFNAGANYFRIPGNFLSGDAGPISPGNNKHIIWDGMQSFPNRYSNEMKLMIIATTAGSINPCPGSPTVTDIDGNVYNTELIGSQCWMKENLRTLRYRNGAEILGDHSWYNNDISWKYLYGGLYTWYAVSNTNSLCPQGWHVPSDEEWIILANHISGGTTTGGRQLKSCRQFDSPLGGNCNTDIHPRWNSNSCYGIDLYGFSALPAGLRSSEGFNDYLGFNAYFWTSTELSNQQQSKQWFIFGNSDQLFQSVAWNTYGLSVRCLKD